MTDEITEILSSAADESSPCARVLRFHEDLHVAVRPADFYQALKADTTVVVRVKTEDGVPIDCRYRNGAVEFTTAQFDCEVVGRNQFLDDVSDADEISIIHHAKSQFKDAKQVRCDGGVERDHIYVGRIPGLYRWSTDYEQVAEWAGGEENVSVMHKRGREYVLNLAEDHPTECCLNRRYNCGHVAYGPPRRLPSACPDCMPAVTDGGTSMGDTERSATCQQCGGNVLLEIDFGESSSHDARILAECDGCGNSAWLSWEEIPPRSVGSETDRSGGDA